MWPIRERASQSSKLQVCINFVIVCISTNFFYSIWKFISTYFIVGHCFLFVCLVLFYQLSLLDVFHQCTGEQWPFSGNVEMSPIQYLQQIDGILSIDNEKKEKLWYVRGKTLTGENRGKIYRSNNQPIVASSKFDLSNQSTWQQPHASQRSTCNQYNSGNSNNFGNGRNTKYNNGERNNNGYTNHNTNTNANNYAPRHNIQLVFFCVSFFTL